MLVKTFSPLSSFVCSLPCYSDDWWCTFVRVRVYLERTEERDVSIFIIPNINPETNNTTESETDRAKVAE